MLDTIRRIVRSKSFKSSAKLTIYTLKISFCIYLVPVFISTGLAIKYPYVSMILITMILLSISPVTHKIIIPEVERRRQDMWRSLSDDKMEGADEL